MYTATLPPPSVARPLSQFLQHANCFSESRDGTVHIALDDASDDTQSVVTSERPTEAFSSVGLHRKLLEIGRNFRPTPTELRHRLYRPKKPFSAENTNFGLQYSVSAENSAIISTENACKFGRNTHFRPKMMISAEIPKWLCRGKLPTLVGRKFRPKLSALSARQTL